MDHPWEVVAALLRSIAEPLLGHVVRSGSSRLAFWGMGRRRERYRRLEVALVQARMRADMVYTIHQQRQSPVNLELMATGVRTAVAGVDALRADLISVLDVVLELRDEGPPDISRCGTRVHRHLALRR